MLQEIFTFLNQKAISTIIVACGGIVAVMLTHYWTTKREIRASHWLRQSEVYKDFVENTIVKLMQEAHDEQIQQQTINNLQHYIIHFVGTLIVWGSSSVIHAYRHFQKVAAVSVPDPEMLISSLEDLLKEIRKDLGHKDKGLKQYDLYNLFLKGNLDIAEEILILKNKGGGNEQFDGPKSGD